MNCATVCSGIGAPDLAAQVLGWQHQFMAEIEPFPRQGLTKHFEGVPLYDDFTKINTSDWLGRVECLVAGTPCQSFSTAGSRGGLDDARGNLALEFIRLVQATECPWLVLENVPGLLSAGLGDILAAITGRDQLAEIERWPKAGLVEESKTGYAAGWRVLDSQFFGVPQRRRRVFIVGSLRGWRSVADVLFKPEGGSWDTSALQRRTERAASQVSATEDGAGAGGVPLVLASAHEGAEIGHDKATTFTHRQDKGPPLVLGGNAPDCVVGVDAAPTLRANQAKGPPLVLNQPRHSRIDVATDKAPTFMAERFERAGSPLVLSGAANANAEVGTDISPTVRANGHPPLMINNDVGKVRIAEDHALTIRSGKRALLPTAPAVIRQMTHLEIERCFGFPDGWTAVEGWRKGNRYKALGNSMAVPVIFWIMQRIEKHQMGLVQIRRD